MMFLPTLVVFLALTATSSAGRLFGKDPKTWSPKVLANETDEIDKCTACKVIIGFIENTQKICTVVPKSLEQICEDLVQEYPPDVLCQKFCVTTNTYEINL